MDFVQNNQQIFAYFGAAALGFYSLRILLHVLRAVRSFFLAPMLGLGVNPSRLGKWAVVTGATDGIGKAYAIALARKGMNVALVSRTKSKLEAVASEIEELAKVETKCVVADFSGGVEIYESISQELDGLDIGILVNNVGVSYEYPEYFHLVENCQQTFRSMLHVNVFSVTFMTSLVLPKMLEKNKGAIVNIGSASCYGFPLLSVYAATKAYVDSFSQNLQYEYGHTGIVIQSVSPHHVSTKMSKIRRATFSSPTPKTYVRSVLGTLGLESCTTGTLSHWLASSATHYVLPTSLLMRLMRGIAVGIRAKALKKKASKKDS